MLNISHAAALALHATALLAGREGADHVEAGGAGAPSIAPCFASSGRSSGPSGRAPGRAAPAAVSELAGCLGVSENHLAKVMQRLARHRLVQSRRGPGGGFTLARPPAQIRLLDVYEAVEGPLADRSCLLEHPICRGCGCVMGGLLGSMALQLREHLERTTLADLAWPHLRLAGGGAEGGGSLGDSP